MNTRVSDQADGTAIPAGLRAPALAPLWSEAKAFVSFLFEMFSPARLRDHGVSRRRGAILSIFLANVEAGIRRLILAAALAFTPPAVVPRKSAPVAPSKPATQRRRAGFHIIRLASQDGTPAIPSQLAARRRPCEPKPYGHMPFPCDPLLSPPPSATPRFARIFAVPTRNPLDRWVRLSRRDPDWLPPEPSGRVRIKPLIDDEDEAPARPKRKRHPPQSSAGLPDSLWDWRRCNDAWTDPVPAPDFAARLEALRRAIANPQALITHTARRIQSHRDATRAHAITRRPNLRRPRRARAIETSPYREDFAPACHARLADTS